MTTDGWYPPPLTSTVGAAETAGTSGMQMATTGCIEFVGLVSKYEIIATCSRLNKCHKHMKCVSVRFPPLRVLVAHF